MTAVFYACGLAPDPGPLDMVVVPGGGIVYIAAWGLVEFHHFLRSARRPYERGMAGVGIVMNVMYRRARL